jgi:hypothetical protein
LELSRDDHIIDSKKNHPFTNSLKFLITELTRTSVMINTIKNLKKEKAQTSSIQKAHPPIHPQFRDAGEPLENLYNIHTKEKLHSRNGHILDLN